MVENVALEQVFLAYFLFPCQYHFTETP